MGIGRRDKNGFRCTSFNSDNENKFPIDFVKVVYQWPFLSSLPFSKVWKKNFMYFGHKLLETWNQYSNI